MNKNNKIKMENIDFGDGRVADVIKAIKSYYDPEQLEDLSAENKLDFICYVLQMPPDRFDRLISDNSPVWRTIKGHSFETVFDHIMRYANYEVVEAGGDTDVDRIVNGFSLQLKTPTESGTNGTIVQYKTHKTHGAKSEVESMDYYHGVNDFADLLVGLISYNPFQIIFLNKNELPRHKNDQDRIQSPFSINWKSHPGLNNYKRIGIDSIKIDPSIFTNNVGNEVLPNTSNIIGVNSDIILDTILRISNFRIWDMSIRGFAREIQFHYIMTSSNKKLYNPSIYRKERGDKSDFMLKRKSDDRNFFFQMKGISTNNCVFKGNESFVACETQLTRGRVNDHPTQSRLYLKSDFDYLIIGLDPAVSKKYYNEIGIKNKLQWAFFAIPTKDLEVHNKMPHRLKSLQMIKFTEILSYLIDDSWIDLW